MLVERWDTGATAPNDGAMRTKLFRLILDRYFPSPESFVDLGAGPCLFANIARDRGHQVTAVDARDVRVPSDLGSIKFVHADVRDFDISGFDVVVCLGLFYHFDIDDQAALLRRCVGRPLILDSQVHVSGTRRSEYRRLAIQRRQSQRIRGRNLPREQQPNGVDRQSDIVLAYRRLDQPSFFRRWFRSSRNPRADFSKQIRRTAYVLLPGALSMNWLPKHVRG